MLMSKCEPALNCTVKLSVKETKWTLLSGLHTTNLSWQTRVGKLQKVGKLVPSHVKLAKFATWPT